MSRRLLKSFFDPFDPFLTHRFFEPTIRFRAFPKVTTYRVMPQEPVKNDPHALFEEFFKEHEIKTEAEKEFFKKHYPQKMEEKFDPYKVLELKEDATVDQIKDAYRSLAIKYHPKNNTQPEAEAKFADISKAYETLMDSKKQRLGQFGASGSFFEDFQKQIDSFISKNEGTDGKQAKESANGKQANKTQKADNFGELYSESSNYQNINGKTKLIIEKIYKKDGKLLVVKREQKMKEDGKIEITETIDNGKQVKKKQYLQESDVKKQIA